MSRASSGPLRCTTASSQKSWRNNRRTNVHKKYQRRNVFPDYDVRTALDAVYYFLDPLFMAIVSTSSWCAMVHCDCGAGAVRYRLGAATVALKQHINASTVWALVVGGCICWLAPSALTFFFVKYCPAMISKHLFRVFCANNCGRNSLTAGPKNIAVYHLVLFPNFNTSPMLL